MELAVEGSVAMSSSGRVLAIDDSPTILRVIRTVLESAGFGVTTVEDPARGVAEAARLSPDLLLVDFLMPGLNGYQVLKQLSDDPDVADIPVVVMCTRSDRVNRDKLSALGIGDYITKPFSPDAIVAVVERTLEKFGRRMREETTQIGIPAESEEELLSQSEFIELSSPSHPAPVTMEGAPLIAEAPSVADAPMLDLEGLSEQVETALTEEGLAQPAEAAQRVVDRLSHILPADALNRLAVETFSEAQNATGDLVPALFGNLALFPLPEVLQLVAAKSHSGMLEVALGQAAFQILLQEGRVVGIQARNASAAFRLGRYFVAGGHLSNDALEEALARASEKGQPLGEYLKEEKHLTTAQLREAVGQQVQDLMYEILRHGRGFFRLDQSRPGHRYPSTRGFLVEELLLEGLRRIDEWNVIEKAIPSFSARFVRTEAADAEGLSDTERAVFEAVPSTEGRDVHDILAQTSLRPFEGCKLLYRLFNLHRIRQVAPVQEAEGEMNEEAQPAV
jgi:twitching motility two-component system response regulator PilH